MLHASCGSPANPIEAENCLTGTPSAQWDINGAGDPTIQGFADQISINRGNTVNFKISTDATAYHLDIYRMGYYAGKGARLIASVNPSAALPQTQPPCVTDSSTNLVDCGTWQVSASWSIPNTATSGIYFAKVIRSDTNGASHIFFIVRDDSSHSDVLFQTSDETWQAYNDWGGHSLYGPTGAFDISNRAYKVSYNRPFNTRTFENASFVFYAEYPMVRWLEAQGYNVTYFTSVDAAARGSLITNHKLYLSNGHDEYWSAQKRASVQAARDAGVNLAFFSGNEMFWKTRWENSIDSNNVPYRTLVCYKETIGPVTDPLDNPVDKTWTGTWRDPTNSPPADGGKPENAITGTLFKVNGCGSDNTDLSIQIPAADGKMRFWRGTPIGNQTAGQTWNLFGGTLGYEWDIDADNGFRPAGLFPLSTATYTLTSDYLLDNGSLYDSGVATHHLSMYRAPSNALVFGAGTVQWAWGLDTNHDELCYSGNYPADQNMQQATVNLFADMGVQPVTLQAPLVPATASSDTTPPVSSITSPVSGANVQPGSTVTITGTAADAGGGVVGGVEVSTDGGATWHPATGRESWSYVWTVAGSGTGTLRSRAVDDSGNLETPSAGVSVNISTPVCPCFIWAPSTTPGVPDAQDGNPYELGVKFRADYDGRINGVRFYKSDANTGTHVGTLYDASGNVLASATFQNETASGWQEVDFASPVSVTANTVYVASYTTSGHYSADTSYLAAGTDNPPLHALANGVNGPNGVFSPNTGFPTQSAGNATNYWVDVSYTPTSTVSLQSITVTPVNPTVAIGSTQQFTATGTYSDNSHNDITAQVTWSASNTSIATINSSGLATGVAGGTTRMTATMGPVSNYTTLTVVGAPLVINTNSLPNTYENQPYSVSLSASGGVQPYTWSLVSGTLPVGLSLSAGGQITGTATALGTSTFTVQVQDSGAKEGGVNSQQTLTKQLSITVVALPTYDTIWGITAPANVDGGDNQAIEVGVKFKADVNGSIIGVRFYKSAANTGVHIGNLWTTSGTLLATAVFLNESASGWQQITFSNPVSVVAGTVYMASYHTNVGHYSADANYFTNSGTDNPPLHALQTGVLGGNGLFAYSANSVFPGTPSPNDGNYWVDVMFVPAPTLTSISVAPANPTLQIGHTQQFAATATYSDSSQQDVTAQAAWSSDNTGVATIDSTGVATAVAGGTSNITAKVGNVSGGTTLTVQAATLSITTTSLPWGAQNEAFAASLSAAGGVKPYTWSLANGSSLPAGLSLSTDGQITGTPTTVGTTSVTFQVQDAGAPGAQVNPQQTVTATLNLKVTITPYTIWASTVTPITVDAGDGNATELGVKFKADVNGSITGIRFYKSSANTGTHIGNLWTTAGTLLATAIFTGESASGWQQVTFATPVPILAGNVYVASYHTATGHYSADAGYFINPVDNPPLHALQNGALGGNGVYTNGASAYPNLSVGPTNYWVDVTFVPAPPLSSITVAPASVTLQIGQNQQYAATANYNDGSSQDVTTGVTWSSDKTGVATVNSSGLATAVAGGSANISASSGAISGSATLKVQGTALSITTTSLPDGIFNAAYGAGLAATGGVQPYTWSLASGSPALPAGLTLSANGQITGTPTQLGTTTFTVQATDAGGSDGVNPQQTVTQQFSITIRTQSFFSIWTSTSTPTQADSNDGNAIEVGVKFQSDFDGTINGIRFYKSAANTGTHMGHLWSAAGTLLGTASVGTETASGWQELDFSSPVAITANTVYVASYHTPGHYAADSLYFHTAGVDNPPLHALQDGISGGNGIFSYDTDAGCNVGVQPCFPSSTFNSGNYWVDVAFVPAVVPASITANPNPVSAGSNSTGTVTLTQAPASDVLVGLQSDSAAAAVPANVTVTAGTTSANFNITTSSVATSTIANISAIYNGMGKSTQLTVSPKQQPGLSLSLSAGTNPSNYGQSLTFTASLAAGPTGTASFYDGGTCSVPGSTLAIVAVSGAQASFTTSTLSASGSPHTILACYSGDANYLSAGTNLSQTVNAVLQSIAVTPANSSLATGSTQQFTATGTYNDNSTQDLTGSATWSSTATGFATITAGGLATGVAAGQTTIHAVSGAVNGSTTLTVYTPLNAVSTTPADGTTAVALNSSISVTFNTAANPATITDNQADTTCVGTLQVSADNFTTCLRMASAPLASNNNQTFTLTVNGSLSGSTTYKVRVTTAAQDPTGHPMAQTYTSASGFTTKPALAITNVSPANGSAGISFSTPISITFNRTIAPASLKVNTAGTSCAGSTLMVSSDGFNTCVPMSAQPNTADNLTYTVQPANSLMASTTFQVRVTTSVTDSDGVPLANLFTTGFTTLAGSAVSPTAFSVVYADSQETVCENGAAANAIDGNPNTNWVTGWCSATSLPPHEIQINLGGSYTITGFSYLPRQDGCANGWINEYEFYVSSDGVNWGTAAATGSFNYGNLSKSCPGGGVPSAMQVNITPVTAQYIRLRALSEVNGNPWTSAAEIGIMGVAASQGVGVGKVTVSPAIVVGGNPSTGTVTLNGPAPSGGATVTLSSSDPSTTVPPSVNVAENSNSANFPITTTSVNTSTQVTIGATYNTSASAKLTVNPASLIPETGWSLVYADSQEKVCTDGSAINAIDGNSASMWITQYCQSSTPGPHEIQINLGAVYSISGMRYLARQDGCANGWISQYQVYVSMDGVNWGSVVSAGTFNYGNLSTTCPGAGIPPAMQVDFAPINGQYVRIRAMSEVNGGPWASAAEINLLGVLAAGQSVGVANVSLNPTMAVGGQSVAATVTLNGAAPGTGALVTLSSDNTAAATVPASVLVPAGGYSASFNITTGSVASPTQVNISASYNNTLSSKLMVNPGSVIPQTAWSVVYADSQETTGENGAAANAIDGNPSTMWVTQWSGGSPAPPHEIRINLGALYSLSAFQYLPRQDGCANGWIKGYEFYVSTDGVNWGTPVATGSFNYGNLSTACPGAGVPSAMQVNFAQATAQYIRLRALTEVNGNPWTSAAEINVIGVPFSAPPANLASVTLNPTMTVGGYPSTGTVTLSGPAPVGGAVVTLQSSNTAVATVPASVTVPAGVTSTTFTVTTTPVGSSTSATISGTYNGTQGSLLTINPGSLIAHTAWTVTYFDSQETVGQNGAATNAIDGNLSTFWVTNWSTANTAPPHEIQINLGAPYSLSAFQYVARQDGCANGWINQYEFYVSTDGVNWGTPVAAGFFNYGNLSTTCPGAGVPGPMMINFTPVNAQYIRLRALSEINGNPWTAVAEINVLGQ